MYGTEFNGDLGYNGHRVFAGFSYGVLFPFGAMAHPVNDPAKGGPGFPFGGPNDPRGDNTNAPKR